MQSYLEKIPDHLKRFADPSLPKEMRLIAAKGLIPIGPKDLAVVLYSLVLDHDDEIKREAEASLTSIPEGVMGAVLSDESTPPELLDYVARNTTAESQLQGIVLNRSASDETIAYLAENVHLQSVIEIIASNQERILRSASIVEALGNNPAITRSTLDRVISFIKLYLDKKGEIPKTPREGVTVQDTSEEASDSELAEEAAQAGGETSPDVQESFLDEINFDQELTEETEEDIGEEKRESLFSLIRKMSMPERIKLAVLGNREARMILIQDPRQIVATTVLQNPRLTDMEVIRISQSKSVDDDVLRGIASTRKWTRVYQVKVALVNNPKTPPDLSLRFITHLRDRELKFLTNNKNVPGVIATTARRMIRERREEGAGGGKH